MRTLRFELLVLSALWLLLKRKSRAEEWVWRRSAINYFEDRTEEDEGAAPPANMTLIEKEYFPK